MERTNLDRTALETRVVKKAVELRAATAADGSIVFEGYVFKWNSLSDDLGGFYETIRKGACTKALQSQKNLWAVLDHEKKVVNALGDLHSKTMFLSEDDTGLKFEIRAGATTGAKDAAVVCERNTPGMSFAFICGKDIWSTAADGKRLRELIEFSELDDISIVLDAAYKSSDVTVAKRSLDAAIAQELEARSVEQGAKPADSAPQAPNTTPTTPPETKPKEPIVSKDTPSIDFLSRQLDLQELEHRFNQPGTVEIRAANAVAAGEEREISHDEAAADAHNATSDALRAKSNTGAPSRALELRAAAAHEKASETATAEAKPSAAGFHTAMAKAHTAASEDGYADEFNPQWYYYRAKPAATNIETRAAKGNPAKGNPRRADGTFHDGAPDEYLDAAAGRMAKAEARHAAAMGDEKADPQYRSECRAAHTDAIAAADQALVDADEAWGRMQTEHRSLVDASKQKLDELAKAHASDAPVE